MLLTQTTMTWQASDRYTDKGGHVFADCEWLCARQVDLLAVRGWTMTTLIQFNNSTIQQLNSHQYNDDTIEQFNNSTMVLQLFNCSIVQVFKCSSVQLFNCSIVQLFNCSIVQLFNCSIVQLLNCWTVELLNCWILSYVGWLTSCFWIKCVRACLCICLKLVKYSGGKYCNLILPGSLLPHTSAQTAYIFSESKYSSECDPRSLQISPSKPNQVLCIFIKEFKQKMTSLP